ncbi:CHAT domain-containing protein [Blastococcus sp. DSM 46786]|uniref:CHAT domain-containing protein n=1 Tax=Blastococcus sp. DSM 46786 TaxID=1798227 RepID=UPI0008C1F1F2|nr:CHAT domain-containing protein [Blastococcus sp. DSM 46786]SEK60058.1 CHAT domain-containing protein [Blastococcus sp. DSM 46786]
MTVISGHAARPQDNGGQPTASDPGPQRKPDGRNLRIVVSAEPTETGWTFVLTCPEDAGFRIERAAVVDVLSGSVPLPATPCCHGPEEWCIGSDPAAADRALRNLRSRSGKGGVAVGHLLFSVLLGEDWPEVGRLARAHDAARVELALSWPQQAAVLNRLPWELMHDGERYLSTSGGEVAVAVTRVVAGTRHGMRELSVPPRVLYVVGAALTDEQIRPGTEMLSLLREIRAAGRRIDHRVLDQATPRRLGRAVASYHPEIVHFICHGGETDDHRGFLRLLSDDAEGASVDLTADQLLEHLRIEGAPPPAVVLSACDTAGASGTARKRTLGGPELAAPLSVDLVRAGVAVVLAMAGTVADRTCRVFTRTFGAALAAGSSLVTATAEARRFAFAETPGRAGVDWALPAVFFSAGVDPDDVHYTEDPGQRLVEQWLGGLTESTPVFCAREAFFDTFWSMLSAGNGGRSGWEPDELSEPKAALAIAVDDAAAGIGKTRLLEEFQRAALVNGHLPLLLGSKGDGPPSDLRAFVHGLGQAFGELTYNVLDIGPGHGRQLHALRKVGPFADAGDIPGLDEAVREALDLGLGAALRAALRFDATRLLDAVRQQFPDVFTAASRCVVLIDDLGRESIPLLTELFERKLLTDHGLGSASLPVPVVLTVRYEKEFDIRRKLAESSDRRSVGVRHLVPFDANTGEDLLAYERVMLHPFREGRGEDLGRRWVFDRDLDEERWTRWTSRLRDFLQGTPAHFHDINYVAALAVGVDGNYLLPATDEDEWRQGGAA